MALPSAPRNLSARYASDGKQELLWSLDYSTAAWSAVYVERSVDGGQWSVIARLGGSAVNYSDISTTSNHVYAYRLRSYAIEGYSPYTPEVETYTTPAAPSSVRLVRTGESSFNIECDVSGVISAEGYRIQRYTPRAATLWATVATVAAFPYGVEVYEDGAMYRVCSVRGSLESPYVESNKVNPSASSDAPLVWGSVQDAVLQKGSEFYVNWEARHEDDSVQASAQIELTVDGSPKTYTYSGGNKPGEEPRFKWRVPSTVMANECTISYRVRTKGAYTDYGSWSESLSHRVGVAPSVSFASPTDGGSVDRLPLVIEWTASSPDGIAYQELTVMKIADASDGAAMFRFRPSSSQRSQTVSSYSSFANGSRWSATLSVTGGSGTTITRTIQFTMAYTGPYGPTADIERGDGLSAVITVHKTPAGTRPNTDTMSVSRQSPDGSTWLVAEGLSDGQSCIDPLPPLNVEFSYKVTAHAASGAVTTTDVPCVIDSDGAEAYNFGPGAGRVVELRFDASSSETVSHDGDTFYFALGPDTPRLPTFYPSGELSASGRRSYTMTSAEEFRALADTVRERSSALCWYRGAFGERAFGTASWSLGYDAKEYGLWSASCSFTECMWEEPENG